MSQKESQIVINIHSKIVPQNNNQNSQINNGAENNTLNQIQSGINEENEGLVNISSIIQTTQKNDKEIDINNNQQDDDEEDEEKLLKQTLLKKPGCIKNGYILYSDTLIDSLIQEKKRSEHLLKQFKIDRQPEWSFLNEKIVTPQDIGDIRVLCITWNMHGNMPQLCTKKLLKTDEVQHHVVVVSSQECQRSIPMSFFCESKQKWEAHVSQELGNEYTMIKSVSMNALHLVVFLHNSIVKFGTAISTDSKATGIANLIGNKGGVGISMDIGEKSFLFINSHFASGQKNNPQRNEDFKKISQSLNLPKYHSNPNESLFNRFNYIFWMGDFNYRIEAQNKTEVDELLQKCQFFELLKRDQLMAQRKIGHVFSEFQEGLILFPPSYKMNDDENKYSDGVNARIPGWTDRIFFKQKNPNTILLLNYEMGLNVFGSDHRPVFAQFLAKVKLNQHFQPISVKQSSSTCNIY